MQGLLLILAGVFAWLSIFTDKKSTRRPDALVLSLLGIFILSGLLSLSFNPNKIYGLLGAPYMRLGALGMIACIGIGLLISRRVPAVRLVPVLYMGISVLAVLSIPFSLWRFESLYRVPGVFAQPDIFACVLGCGFLLGLELWSRYPSYRNSILAVQLFLTSLLVLTQTRAVIALVILLTTLWMVRAYRQKAALVFIITALFICGVYYLLPGRLSHSYVAESVNYRFSLQEHAFKSSTQKPFLGYGPGNLADALDCKHLDDKSLRKTCDDGYFFNSSHNIFLDRVLMVGWIGGVAFLVLVSLIIYRGLHGDKDAQILALAALLIATYYFTNVTSVTLELLFWILLLSCAPHWLVNSPKNTSRV